MTGDSPRGYEVPCTIQGLNLSEDIVHKARQVVTKPLSHSTVGGRLMYIRPTAAAPVVSKRKGWRTAQQRSTTSGE